MPAISSAATGPKAASGRSRRCVCRKWRRRSATRGGASGEASRKAAAPRATSTSLAGQAMMISGSQSRWSQPPAGSVGGVALATDADPGFRVGPELVGSADAKRTVELVKVPPDFVAANSPGVYGSITSRGSLPRPRISCFQVRAHGRENHSPPVDHRLPVPSSPSATPDRPSSAIPRPPSLQMFSPMRQRSIRMLVSGCFGSSPSSARSRPVQLSNAHPPLRSTWR